MAVTWVSSVGMTYDEWLLNRNKSIGASEVATIVFGSKYSSSLEIFYAKIGAPKSNYENLRMYLGKVTEEISADLWKHYAGTEQSVVDNIRKGTPVKDCVDLKATAFNDKFPWLSATPDRKILPVLKYAGRGDGSLEIKNTQGFILRSYEGKLPVENIIQLVTQMMVCEWDYGNLFYFVDNMRCECHELERGDLTKGVEETVLHHTEKFWTNVLAGRKVYNAMYEAKRSMNMRMVAECERELASLEPPVQNTDGWRSFLTKRYEDKLAGVGVIPGKPEQLQIAKAHKELSSKIEILETEQRALDIQLKMAMGDYNTLDFGKEGKVYWKENKNGTRIFSNKIK
jgi:predicted phage-related endonuclease